MFFTEFRILVSIEAGAGSVEVTFKRATHLTPDTVQVDQGSPCRETFYCSFTVLFTPG